MAHQWHTVHYTAAATLAAAALFYVFGPTLLPDHDAESRPRKGAVGLSNSANDCFVSSILQALAGSPRFMRFLQEQTALDRQHGTDGIRPASHPEPPPDDSSSDAGSSVSGSLNGILDKLHDPALNGTAISPRYFIAFVEYTLGTYIGRQQQDAQELLQVLAERIATETSKMEKRLKDVDPEAQTPPFPLEGVLESQIECQTCHYQPAPRRSSFNMLSLTMPHQWSASLDDCFDDLLKQEIIDDYKCDRCRLEHAINVKQWRIQREKSEPARDHLQTELDEMTQALTTDPSAFADVQLDLAKTQTPSRQITRSNRIASFPPVLVVHLSRSIFTGSGASKNKCDISFGEKLRLGGLREKHVYRLVSVVTHRGSHNSGHYETFRRQANDGASRAPAAREKTSLEKAQLSDGDSTQIPSQTLDANSPSYQAAEHSSRPQTAAVDGKLWSISDDGTSRASAAAPSTDPKSTSATAQSFNHDSTQIAPQTLDAIPPSYQAADHVSQPPKAAVDDKSWSIPDGGAGRAPAPAPPSAEDKSTSGKAQPSDRDSTQMPSQTPAAISPSYQAAEHKSRPRKTAVDDKWWGISDAHVRECRTKDVLLSKQTVYLLFYEKIR